MTLPKILISGGTTLGILILARLRMGTINLAGLIVLIILLAVAGTMVSVGQKMRDGR